MNDLTRATTRELEIEQVRRRIAKGDAEIKHILVTMVPGMLQKQHARREELKRQEAIHRAQTLPYSITP